MHRVDQPHDTGEVAHQAFALRRRKAPRVSEPSEIGLHLVEPRHALARRDDEHVQRAPLPRPGVLDEPRAVGGRGVCSAFR